MRVERAEADARAAQDANDYCHPTAVVLAHVRAAWRHPAHGDARIDDLLLRGEVLRHGHRVRLRPGLCVHLANCAVYDSRCCVSTLSLLLLAALTALLAACGSATDVGALAPLLSVRESQTLDGSSRREFERG